MSHNERSRTGHHIPCITMVVINVDTKVVNFLIDLFHKDICTIPLIAVVQSIKSHVMWISPASAVAITLPMPTASILIHDWYRRQSIGTCGFRGWIADYWNHLDNIVFYTYNLSAVTEYPRVTLLMSFIRENSTSFFGSGWC